MTRKDPYDIVHIRGKEYSIKKIEKLYEKDTAKPPKMMEGINLVWFCPSCNEFHNIDVFSGIKDKYCAHCGQRIKWPRAKKKEVTKPVVKKGDSKNVQQTERRDKNDN